MHASERGGSCPAGFAACAPGALGAGPALSFSRHSPKAALASVQGTAAVAPVPGCAAGDGALTRATAGASGAVSVDSAAVALDRLAAALGDSTGGCEAGSGVFARTVSVADALTPMVPVPVVAEPPGLEAGAGIAVSEGCADRAGWVDDEDVPREANQAIETTSTTADTPAMRSMVLREREGGGEGSAGGGPDPLRERGALHW